MVPNSLIFDLDGTLIDSVPDVHLALNNMLAEYDLPGIAFEKMHYLIGTGAKSLVKDAFAEHSVTLSEENLSAALQCYLSLYRNNPVVKTLIYPGVIDTLQHFQKTGFKLAICTNKPATMTKLVLERLKLANFFSVVISGDEISKPKPHQDHLHAVIKALAGNAKQTVFIGDSDIDYSCAQNANVPFVGVRYGYHLGTLQAHHMVNHFNELPRALEELANE